MRRVGTRAAARALAVFAGLILGNVGLGFLWGTPSLHYRDASAFLVSCGKLPKTFDPQDDKTRPLVADLDSLNLGLYARHSPRLDYLPERCGVPEPCRFHITLSRFGPYRRVSRADFSSGAGMVDLKPQAQAWFEKRLGSKGGKP